ncbi:hypothetical protein GCM10011512_13390 [Tersicoccus solisilvae]|uniref:DUF304 domain-containing protein n=1 Tax=Tersicoccus solisilvae TaxID=1882339 RepID=A0ABQ1P6J1_9MICC|nr:hypothetical protein [Tersicoccus solisilvae]GGC87757.1 hypothetical protein GCM10011512_13390 [Tersicoccus solisilvae]
MKTVRAWLARLFVLPARRRHWIFVGMVVGWYATSRLVVALLDRTNPLYWIAVPILGYGGLISLATIWTSFTSGMLFGRLLPLPRHELVRFAERRFRSVETWPSPLSVDDLLARLSDLPPLTTPVLVQPLPDGMFLRYRRWHQPEPWPSSAPPPRRIKVRADVLIVVTARLDGGATIDAHWDGEPRLTDAMRARARLGRDVVDAARALTEQVERETDATSGGDR